MKDLAIPFEALEHGDVCGMLRTWLARASRKERHPAHSEEAVYIDEWRQAHGG